jgi:hypothetical protein
MGNNSVLKISNNFNISYYPNIFDIGILIVLSDSWICMGFTNQENSQVRIFLVIRFFKEIKSKTFIKKYR